MAYVTRPLIARARLWIALIAATTPKAAFADTLAEALAEAYRANPTLQSQRAQLSALNEEYVQARSGLRPQINVQLSASAQNAQQNSIFGSRETIRDDPDSATLNLVQPLYTGGRVSSTIRAAEADILAGREALRTAEASVLLNVIQSYADVRLNEQIVNIRAEELKTLQSQLDDATARFKAGEVTRTDVSQSKAQLQSSLAQQQIAEGQLQVSRAAYTAVVGVAPIALDEPPVLPGLPVTVGEAFDAAEADNSDLQRSRFAERASHARIAEAKAASMPQVNLQAGYGYSGQASPFYQNEHLHDFSVGLVLNQLITSGGVNASNTRRQIELNSSDRASIEVARRAALQGVSQAWNGYMALRKSALTDREDVTTSKSYFDDTVTEYRIGQRGTLDVLIAEQTFRAAEIAQVQAEHDSYIASAQLLSAMGRLNASALFETLPPDQVANAFRKVKNASSVPWEGIIAALDKIGAPGGGPSLQASAASLGGEGPPAIRAGRLPPADAPLSTDPATKLVHLPPVDQAGPE